MSVTGGGNARTAAELDALKMHIHLNAGGSGTWGHLSETTEEDRDIYRVAWGDHIRAPGATVSQEWYLSLNNDYVAGDSEFEPAAGEGDTERDIPLLAEGSVDIIDDSTNGLAYFTFWNDWPGVSFVDKLGFPIRWRAAETLWFSVFGNFPGDEDMTCTVYYQEA